jgi:hypothetical protein
MAIFSSIWYRATVSARGNFFQIMNEVVSHSPRLNFCATRLSINDSMTVVGNKNPCSSDQ